MKYGDDHPSTWHKSVKILDQASPAAKKKKDVASQSSKYRSAKKERETTVKPSVPFAKVVPPIGKIILEEVSTTML